MRDEVRLTEGDQVASQLAVLLVRRIAEDADDESPPPWFIGEVRSLPTGDLEVRFRLGDDSVSGTCAWRLDLPGALESWRSHGEAGIEDGEVPMLVLIEFEEALAMTDWSAIPLAADGIRRVFDPPRP